MTKQTWHASAPSNIALIKYMGKTDAAINAASNPSLSYTLPHLKTHVSLELSDETSDQWLPLTHPDCQPCELSTDAQTRFLNHLNKLKQHFNYSGNFLVRSANTFPANCGLASSASSFAALTRVACQALSELTSTPLSSVEEQAQLSQHGSGSSCRSFFQPWVLWESDQVREVTTPYPKLLHAIIMLTEQPKAVSSSLAHQRISSSLLFNERALRAQQRLDTLLSALQKNAWQQAYEIIWQEFWDMHALFATAHPPFHYFTEKTFVAFDHIQQIWQTHEDGPWVTVDAGPNIHLLFRPDQINLYHALEKTFEDHWYGSPL